jgi:hypothetical protein
MAILLGAVAAVVAAAFPSMAQEATSISMTANVRHAKVGELVTFTSVVTNTDAGDTYDNLNPPFSALIVGLDIVEVTCDQGLGPDGYSCEYGAATGNQSYTTTTVARVLGTQGKLASLTRCVYPGNDCATVSVRVIGRRP